MGCIVDDQLRILIVDDDHQRARTLVDILKVKGYHAQDAYSGVEALEMVGANSFDRVLTDIKMPDMNGMELHKSIKDKHPDLPVMMMTAYITEELVREGLEEGAVACRTKPLDINKLLHFLSMLRIKRTVIIVDDDSSYSKTLTYLLEMRHYKVLNVADPDELLDVILMSDGYQIVLLDMKLKGTRGLEVLKKIRKQVFFLPVILVTGFGEEIGQLVKEVYEYGAYTCLCKPLKHEELLRVLEEIHRRELRKVLNNSIGRYEQGVS